VKVGRGSKAGRC